MSNEEAARIKLKSLYKKVSLLRRNPNTWSINSHSANLRMASGVRKFWFDVTPELYEKLQVEFFIYACGGMETVYVLPCINLQHFVRSAGRSRRTNAPNFTIYTATDEFEPAGHSEARFNIAGFRNAYFLIPN